MVESPDNHGSRRTVNVPVFDPYLVESWYGSAEVKVRRKVLSPLRCLTVNDMIVIGWNDDAESKAWLVYMLLLSARWTTIDFRNQEPMNGMANQRLSIPSTRSSSSLRGARRKERGGGLYPDCCRLVLCSPRAGGLLFQSASPSSALDPGISTRFVACRSTKYYFVRRARTGIAAPAICLCSH